MNKTLLAVSLALAPIGALAQGITGSYSIAGTNFDGSPYGGVAQITALSDVTCEIVWNTDGVVSNGICMRDGPVVAAGYVLDGDVGLVIYRQGSDGRLVGSWTIAGSDGVGTEVLTPR